MLIQLHILQNYAPSNLNRDDTGSPKDTMFGGVRRGRISSQCLKRSIRRSQIFADAFAGDDLLAVRTKRLPTLVDSVLQQMGADTEARSAIVRRVPEIGTESGKSERRPGAAKGAEAGAEPAKADKKTDSERAETRQLIFVGGDEVKALSANLYRLYQELGDKEWNKRKIDEITNSLGATVPRSVDVAMFGRMTTSAAFEDVQAAVQVAHALSTNSLAQEFDYYTAVDDLSGESGAGMIGDVEFNSSTYYRYLNVHWDQLIQNLGNDREVARRAVTALVKAAALAQPSGKQNSFAAYNPPDFIMIEVAQSNLPISYANAFLKPIQPSHSDTALERSVDALATYVAKVSLAYDFAPRRAYLTLVERALPDAQPAASLTALADWTAAQLAD